MHPWAAEYVTHYVDLQDPEKHWPGAIGNAKVIRGSLDDPKMWIEICDGKKFDFAICTQTLEHVLNPAFALEMISSVAKEGFIGIPNKYVELYKKAHINKQEDLLAHNLTDYFRGFAHHRWIITIRDNVVWFWPKLGFLEFLKLEWADSDELKTSEELCFRWKDSIQYKIITDVELDFSTPYEVCRLYKAELEKGL